MKVKLTLKDPDRIGSFIDHSARQQLAAIAGLTKQECALLYEARRDLIAEKLRQWIEDGEYLTVEFDLEARTATVMESAR